MGVKSQFDSAKRDYEKWGINVEEVFEKSKEYTNLGPLLAR